MKIGTAPNSVPLDPVRAMPFFKYHCLQLSFVWKRWRGKLPATFKCNCGEHFRWTAFEYMQWSEIQTIWCLRCQDCHRVLQGTLVHTIPNPHDHRDRSIPLLPRPAPTRSRWRKRRPH